MPTPTSPAPPDGPLWRELTSLVTAPRPRVDPAWAALHDVIAGRAPRRRPDWPAVAQAAHLGEVVGVVADHAMLRALLAQSVRRQVLVDMSLELALDRAAKAFERRGLDRMALLKGSATAPTLYHPPWRRARRDIDVLVAREDLLAAVAALEADGWRSDPMPGEAALGPLAVRAWPMVLDLPVGPMACDLHQRLFDERGFDVDVHGLLARRVHGVAPLPVAHPEDTLLHTALHMARGGFQEPLKAWVDMLLLCRSPAVDLERVAVRAREWRAGPALWGCLHVLDRWFGYRAPTSVARSITPPPVVRALLARALSGTGPDPLRQGVSRRTAVGAVALLVADGAAARGRYLRGILRRRMG